MEKYSVLMSLYIKEKPDWLDSALQSMLNQSLVPDEIIVVKDGPITDLLQEVLDRYSRQYPDMIHVVGYETNRGLGPALQFGLEQCRNELVARMDTDDISLPDRCEKQVVYMEDHPDTAIVGGQIEEFIGEIQNVVGKRVVPCEDPELKKYCKKRCPFNHVTVMFRKSAVLNAGSYQEWFCNEDYYLWIRMALANKVFGNLPDTLVKVRVGEDMYQRRGGRQYFKSERELQKYMLRHHLINYPVYVSNVFMRFVLQVVFPNQIRGWVFRTFARQ